MLGARWPRFDGQGWPMCPTSASMSSAPGFLACGGTSCSTHIDSSIRDSVGSVMVMPQNVLLSVICEEYRTGKKFTAKMLVRLLAAKLIGKVHKVARNLIFPMPTSKVENGVSGGTDIDDGTYPPMPKSRFYSCMQTFPYSGAFHFSKAKVCYWLYTSKLEALPNFRGSSRMDPGLSSALNLREALNALNLESQETETVQWMEKILVGKLLTTRNKIKKGSLEKTMVNGPDSPHSKGMVREETLPDIDFQTSTFYIQVARFVLPMWTPDSCGREMHIFRASHYKDVEWDEIDSLHYTLNDLGAGDRFDFPNLVVEKARTNHGDLAKLSAWARQGAEMIACGLQSRRIREIDLHGMGEELADWLNLGSGRILNAVGSGRPKPIRLNSKKREAFGFLEGSFREGVVGLSKESPEEENFNSPVTERLDGLIVDLTNYGPGEVGTSLDVPRIEEVELQLQSTNISAPGFKNRRDTPRYFTRSLQRRQSWKTVRSAQEGESSRGGASSSFRNLSDGNGRGTGRKETVHELKGLIKKWRPSCLFLAETKSTTPCMEKLGRQLSFDRIEVVKCCGQAGGLVLMWSKDVKIEIIEKDPNCIVFTVADAAGTTSWKGFASYGPNTYTDKKKFWEKMELIIKEERLPWMMFGDLNEIVEELIWVSGRKFTWLNRQEKLIKERLDRAIADMGWIHLYPDYSAWSLNKVNGAEYRKICYKLAITAKALKVRQGNTLGVQSIDKLEEELRILQQEEDRSNVNSGNRQKWIGEELRKLRCRQESIYRQKSKELCKYREVLLEEFEKLYSSDIPCLPRDLQDLINQDISVRENEELMAIPSGEEIRKAVQDIHPQKVRGAFLKGRWIAENSLVAQELVHKVKKHRGKKGLMLVKLDLKKRRSAGMEFLGCSIRCLGFFEQTSKVDIQLC
ncbi:hypothetical protein FNV43_RR00324 [Rhamnella rubrinervis]|uniref:Uncharacterized protein n=1 Tax=Rhamnella rubrinervis TaxID=2594499 RepID=A0A8K0HMU1_9ROSA|nr:hypothetical protein FNV43_RR00324 [Rhamnella rubrinervis]